MIRKKNYRFFNYHLFSCTCFVLLMSGLISIAAVNTDIFNPLKNAFKDFDVTDLAFQKFRESKDPGQDIVLVNIGNLDRTGLAAELNVINRFSPAVVGIDAFFNKPKDPVQDFQLAMAMNSTENLVLVSRLDSVNDTTLAFGHVTRSLPIFSANAHGGYANFITGGDDGFLTTRRFTARETVADTTEVSFAARILELYDKEAYRKLMSRPAQQEIINYSGNLDKFIRLDVHQVLDSGADLSFLKGKIVLMGYLGEPMGAPSLTDVFFTPLNQNIAGRGFPDMYGITVHANILSMMIRGDYIEQTPESMDYILGVLLCFFNVGIFLYFARKARNISQVVMRTVQFVQAFLITGFMLYMLTRQDYRVELGFTLGLIFFTGDLTEIYQNAAFSYVEKVRQKQAAHRITVRREKVKKRLLEKEKAQ